MNDTERLAKMRLDWQQGRDWTADPREGLRQIKRLERKIEAERMNPAAQIFTTAISIDHTHKSRATLARHRASGTYDADAAERLLRNNARHACKVSGVRPSNELIDKVVQLLQEWCISSESHRE